MSRYTEVMTPICLNKMPPLKTSSKAHKVKPDEFSLSQVAEAEHLAEETAKRHYKEGTTKNPTIGPVDHAKS